jgi:hypothetical protein
MKKLIIIIIAASLIVGLGLVTNNHIPLVTPAHAAGATTLTDGIPAANANAISFADIPLPFQLFVGLLVVLCVLIAVFPVFMSDEEIHQG